MLVVLPDAVVDGAALDVYGAAASSAVTLVEPGASTRAAQTAVILAVQLAVSRSEWACCGKDRARNTQLPKRSSAEPALLL